MEANISRSIHDKLIKIDEKTFFEVEKYDPFITPTGTAHAFHLRFYEFMRSFSYAYQTGSAFQH